MNFVTQLIVSDDMMIQISLLFIVTALFCTITIKHYFYKKKPLRIKMQSRFIRCGTFIGLFCMLYVGYSNHLKTEGIQDVKNKTKTYIETLELNNKKANKNGELNDKQKKQLKNFEDTLKQFDEKLISTTEDYLLFLFSFITILGGGISAGLISSGLAKKAEEIENQEVHHKKKQNKINVNYNSSSTSLCFFKRFSASVDNAFKSKE